jgi:hypothetical protein
MIERFALIGDMNYCQPSCFWFVWWLAVVSRLVLCLSPEVFPISTRKALAQKAIQVNPPFDTTVFAPNIDLLPKQPSYDQYGTTNIWSNRAAVVLTPVLGETEKDGTLGRVIYTADRPFYWNKIDVSCRMVVVELSTKTNGKPDLWIHSPVGLDDSLYQSLARTGNVKHIVSPNYEHVKFVKQWAKAYPDACVWACPGLSGKMTNVQWTGEISSGYRPSNFVSPTNVAATTSMSSTNKLWDIENEIQMLHVDTEHIPVLQKPYFNEVIFFHVPTATLIITDLLWNYPDSTVPNAEFGRNDTWELAPIVSEVPLASRIWKVGMDRIYYPFYKSFMVRS